MSLLGTTVSLRSRPEWQQYRELDWESIKNSMRGHVLLDGRNLLDRARLSKAGFRYLSLAG